MNDQKTSMRFPLQPVALMAISIALLGGCGFGAEEILFVTKSTVGVDFDAQPPTASIAISRQEGLLEPTFEDGKTLPVLSSFRPENKGIVSGNVGQTFAVGDAAVAMATLYNNPDYLFVPGSDNWETDVAARFDSTLTLDGPVTLPGGKAKRDHKEVRPVFFGTRTSLGLAVNWSAITSAIPDSFQLGYRRKEVALAPVNYVEKTGTSTSKTHVGTPSLLATIDVATKASNAQDTEVTWLQYFATGRAATALALRRDVRAAMLSRMDPKQATAFQVRGGGLTKVAVVSLIYGALKDQENVQAKFHVSRLDALGSKVPANYPFNKYGEKDDGSGIRIENQKGSDFDTSVVGYDKLAQYWGEILNTSKLLRKTITETDDPIQVNDTPLDDEIRKTLMTDLEHTHTAKEKLLIALEKTSDVIVDAVDYYLSLPE